MKLQRLNRHLDDCRAVVERLKHSGRTDNGVLSVLLVESFFRPMHEQLLELLAWPLVWMISRARVGALSLGPGQIQLRHWCKAESWVSLAPTWSKARRILSWEASFDIAERLLADAPTAQKRAALYRGEARSYHLSCLLYTESWLRQFDV